MSDYDSYENQAKRWLQPEMFDSNAKLQAHIDYMAGLMKKAEKYDELYKIASHRDNTDAIFEFLSENIPVRDR